MTRLAASIDAGKDNLDIYLGGADRRLPNSRDGFRAAAKWFRAETVGRVVLEATGRPAWTDQADASVLAEFGAAFAAQPRGEFLDRLGDMLVVRERLVDRRSSLRQTFSEVGDPLSRKAGPASSPGSTRTSTAATGRSGS